MKYLIVIATLAITLVSSEVYFQDKFPDGKISIFFFLYAYEVIRYILFNRIINNFFFVQSRGKRNGFIQSIPVKNSASLFGLPVNSTLTPMTKVYFYCFKNRIHFINSKNY